MHKTIALLPGDGIGPEVVKQAVKSLDAVAVAFDHQFEYKDALVGGVAYDACGEHLPQETLDVCFGSDAVLYGSVGGPVEEQDRLKWKDAERNSVLGIRKALNLSINLRPASVYPELAHLSPLKPERLGDGVDLLVVRELLSGIYFGKHETLRQARNGDIIARDVMEYSQTEIRKPMEFAFEAAKLRRKKVTVVDKANVLDCSRLWRKVAEEVASGYPDIELEFMYIDNSVQQVIKNPSQFDVIATGNMFGDILSDACAMLPGSLGLMPSASLGDKIHLYEPIGGSAPKHTGKNDVNPIAQILSAALLLRYSFNMEDEAQAIERAVRETLGAGERTYDVCDAGMESIGTEEMGDKVAGKIRSK